MDSDYDYNLNTSDEESGQDPWEEEQQEQEEKKEISYKVCCEQFYFTSQAQVYNFDLFAPFSVTKPAR